MTIVQGVKCPGCGGLVDYNGNYACLGWLQFDSKCGWQCMPVDVPVKRRKVEDLRIEEAYLVQQYWKTHPSLPNLGIYLDPIQDELRRRGLDTLEVPPK